MKKPVVVATALLLSCSLAFSQEADDAVSGVGFSIIPRLDFSPVFPFQSAKDLTLGNSSLYTLFEGSFLDERLSFSISNHWLSTSPADLYVYEDEDGRKRATVLRSDYSSWIDWATLTFSVSGFDFTIGKDAMFCGGFESDLEDYDVHPALASSNWNNFCSYQWGASVGYTLPSENHYFAFQAATSPYGEHPFASKLFAYSLLWRGTFGAYSTKLTATALQTDFNQFIPMISFGQAVEFDDSRGRACLDLLNTVTDEDGLVSYKAITAMGTVSYNPIENVELFARGGFEHDFEAEGRKSGFYAGAGVHWYPIENLRLHLLGAINHGPNSGLLNWDGERRNYMISIGAVYHLNFGILK